MEHLTGLIPARMTGVQLLGHGGLDMLRVADDLSVPTPGPDDVLIRVAAAGINNTDINTRIGWYSKQVTTATNDGASAGFAQTDSADASWTGAALEFPRIQGADCCGHVVAVGDNVAPSRIGERVIVRAIMRTPVDHRPFECWTLGSECDGAFAQYTLAPAPEAYRVNCDWSDVELASIPCAYSTAENMLHRARVGAERVLVTGASGGVGSAAVQLARRRGAEVLAVAGPSKAAALLELGATHVFDRSGDWTREVADASIDVVVDLVAGPDWPRLLDLMRRGGRYVTAGAIGGPSVQLDVRTLYLKDLTLFGSTFQDDVVFDNLVRYIERNEIRPLVAKTFPLTDIAAAQTEFMDKGFVGKLVLIPPG